MQECQSKLQCCSRKRKKRNRKKKEKERKAAEQRFADQQSNDIESKYIRKKIDDVNLKIKIAENLIQEAGVELQSVISTEK